ncbi:MAG: hypothetical protein A2X08_17055 [Bacteroidetes bacterium GWA2_32_17]|nr:MAG: hypothetical protein A2X08_17055 [Bacteroidetes bacterium GWA2_32_17]
MIAKAFKEIGKVEKYGSGIKRIFTICQNYGIIAPQINISATSFEVVLYKNKKNEELNGGLNGGLNEGLNDRQKQTLAKIRTTPGIKIKELSEVLEIPIDTLDRYINIFVKMGAIERRGSKKKGGYFAK